MTDFGADAKEGREMDLMHFFKKTGLLSFHPDTARCHVSADHAEQTCSTCICLCQTMNTLSNSKLYLNSYFSFSHSYSDLCMIYSISTGKAS